MQKIDVHGLTLKGNAHRNNHDHFAIATLSKSMRLHQSNLSIDDDSRVHGRNLGHLFMVADGVSGGPSPARASGTAVDGIVQYFLNDMPWSHFADREPKDVIDALRDALKSSQQEIFRRAVPDDAGMGSTLTLAFVFWPDLYVAHVGDSRCYLLRDDELRQLTTDHTLAELRREVGGKVTERSESTLWNAVGGRNMELHSEVTHTVLHRGDVLSLVTDGVLRGHDVEALRTAMKPQRTAETICEELIDGRDQDDQTAVVVRFLPLEASTSWSAVQESPPRDEKGAQQPTRRTPAAAACPRSRQPTMKPVVGVRPANVPLGYAAGA